MSLQKLLWLTEVDWGLKCKKNSKNRVEVATLREPRQDTLKMKACHRVFDKGCHNFEKIVDVVATMEHGNVARQTNIETLEDCSYDDTYCWVHVTMLKDRSCLGLQHLLNINSQQLNSTPIINLIHKSNSYMHSLKIKHPLHFNF